MRQIALLCCLLLMSVAQAKDFSSLEERMSEREFKAAGLDKLSAEELAALNAWLRDRSVAPGAAVAVTPPMAQGVDADRRGFPVATGPDEVIRSHIVGRFEGWRGAAGQKLRLANGQVWETQSGRAFSVKLDDPAVTIEPGFLGNWYLRVDGYNARISVRRVQ